MAKPTVPATGDNNHYCEPGSKHVSVIHARIDPGYPMKMTAAMLRDRA